MADKLAERADVIVAGAGFAGSLLALTLARRGISVHVADVREVYPPDFRCEKLGPDQIAILAELGALEPIAVRARLPARAGGFGGFGAPYQDMVNGLRAAWPESVCFHPAKVAALRTSDDEQVAELSTGERLVGRLAVLATGRNERLSRSIGVRRRTLRNRHSLSIGISLAAGEGRPPIPSVILRGGRGGDGVGLISLFPMNGATRVNLFCYRDPGSAWARSFRQDPLAALLATFPDLAPVVADARVLDAPDFGVVDLYETEGYVQPGVVLAGDAFRSSCPATAMGLTRALTDVRQLGLIHIPAWLNTPGMDARKIAAFYADPVKRGVDRRSRRKAEFGRFEATARGPAGEAFRLARRVHRALTQSPTPTASSGVPA